MRIVFLTQVVPNPPDAGPKVKTHYVLRTLATEHQIELITFARTPEEVAAAEALRPWCARVITIPLRRQRLLEPYYALRGWGSATPFLVARDARRAMREAIRARLARGDVDVLHADQLAMAQYLPLARGGAASTIFDAHNAVWELVRELAPRQPTPAHRLAAEIEWRLLRRYERRSARASSLTLCVSAHDREALVGPEEPLPPTMVIPIGIEVESTPFAPPDDGATRLLSVGTMFYPPNVEAIRWFRAAIWPGVVARCPEARLDIVGQRPPADLSRWADADGRVRVPGYVADLDALYREAAVFIVPLRSGSGVRVKVLEAMARGVPVVSTTVGVAGLAVRHGEHLLIADTAEEFAAAIEALLGSPERRRALALAARALVLEQYDWRRCCRPILAAYRRFARD